MTIYTDKDDFTVGTNIIFDLPNQTIELVATGGMTGATGQAIYSLCDSLWLQQSYAAYDFPIKAITNEQFQYVNGWRPKNDTTRKLHRNCGWEEQNASGDTLMEWMGIRSQPDTGKNLTGTPYYFWAGATSKTDFDNAGDLNEPIQIYGDASNGNFDYRSTNLTIRNRVYGKTYASATSAGSGYTTLTYKLYIFSLSEDDDLKIADSDANVDANAPYTSMTFNSGAFSRSVNGTNRDFSWELDANGGTVEQAHTYLKHHQRTDGDIDDNAGAALNGFLAEDFTEFAGDTLKTKLTTQGGVYITNLDPNDSNKIIYVDDLGIERTPAFIAAGTIEFNGAFQNLSGVGKYFMFQASTFNSASADLVQDDTAADITGDITGTEATFTYDYDNYNLNGHGAGTDLNVVVIGQAAGVIHTKVTATLKRATGQVIQLNGQADNVYAA